MRLNGNQIDALAQLRGAGEEGDYFHFDILGTDPLDKRVVRVKAWTFLYGFNKEVDIDENGTLFERGSI
jgi:hypothetical protein